MTFTIVISLNGCSNLWNIANRSYFKKDINKVLKPYELDDMNCDVIGYSRTGHCIFSSSSQFINQLIVSLELQKYSSTDINVDKIKHYKEIPRLVTLEKGCELIPPFSEISSVVIYQSSQNSRKLIFDSGRFSYLLLYYHPQMSKSCIQVTYSYG